MHLLCKESIDTASLASAVSEPNLAAADSSHHIDKSSAFADSPELKEKRTRFLNMIKRLLDEFKMNPNEKDLSEFTPLMYACEHSDIELIDILVNHEGNKRF